MTPAARLSAALEVLAAIEMQRRPAAEALKDWGQSHRFAGAKDRVGIASIVYDALRVKRSAAWLMGAETPRAITLGMLARVRHMTPEAIALLCSGERFAPEPLTDEERARLVAGSLEGAPDAVRADVPDWLAPQLAEVFGADLVVEGEALAARAPVDLRANLLVTTRERALEALDHLGAQPTPLSPWGLRIPVTPDGRGPALQAEPAYVKGQVEVQDEGSQLASLLSGAAPGQQVLDLCAGGGGKTLALAAMMANKGQLYATDSDGRRLMPIFDRLERASVRNVQVRAPKGQQEILGDLESRCDLVLVDAPCTGTGTWRRSPDAKWRTRPGALEQRMKEQDEVLERAARFVKPGGALVYITCSLLRAENEDRVSAFLGRHESFLPRDAAHMAKTAGVPALAERASPFGAGLRLTPRTCGTDGFYVAALVRGA